MKLEYLDEETIKEIQEFMYEKAKGKFCFAVIVITPDYEETGEIGVVANLRFPELAKVMKAFVKEYEKKVQ